MRQQAESVSEKCTGEDGCWVAMCLVKQPSGLSCGYVWELPYRNGEKVLRKRKRLASCTDMSWQTLQNVRDTDVRSQQDKGTCAPGQM